MNNFSSISRQTEASKASSIDQLFANKPNVNIIASTNGSSNSASKVSAVAFKETFSKQLNQQQTKPTSPKNEAKAEPKQASKPNNQVAYISDKTVSAANHEAAASKAAEASKQNEIEPTSQTQSKSLANASTEHSKANAKLDKAASDEELADLQGENAQFSAKNILNLLDKTSVDSEKPDTEKRKVSVSKVSVADEFANVNAIGSNVVNPLNFSFTNLQAANSDNMTSEQKTLAELKTDLKTKQQNIAQSIDTKNSDNANPNTRAFNLTLLNNNQGAEQNAQSQTNSLVDDAQGNMTLKSFDTALQLANRFNEKTGTADNTVDEKSAVNKKVDDTQNSKLQDSQLALQAAKTASSKLSGLESSHLKSPVDAKIELVANQNSLVNQTISLQNSTQNAAQTLGNQAVYTSNAGGINSNQIGTPFGQTGWDKAISQRVMLMIGSAEQTATLTLNPPDLGPLQIVVHVHNNQADATFITDHTHVREALENSLGTLKDMMKQAGVEMGNTAFSTSQQSFSQQNLNQQGFNQQAQQQFQQAQQQAAQLSYQSRGQNSGGVQNDDTLTKASSRVSTIVKQGLVDTFA